MNYFISVLAAGSQFLNALTGGNRDQTFSSRCYEAAVIKRKWLWWIPYLLINALYRPWQRNHCKDAYEYDSERTYA